MAENEKNPNENVRVDTAGGAADPQVTQIPRGKGKSAPKQELQTEPRPDVQKELTADVTDRVEVHEVDKTAPHPRDLRSAEAPGIRTEAEVVQDHIEANERAARALRVNGHTADPAVSTSAVKVPRVENRERQVYFRNTETGRIDSVNEGTPEHGVILVQDGFEEVSRAEADAYEKSLA